MALSRRIRLQQYLDDWLIRAQSQEEAQVNTQTVVDLTHSSVRTKANSGVFLCGLRIPSRFSPCKTHSREMAQTLGFDPTTQVKTCFDCKMFDVANWVACLNGENGPRGMPSHEALSVSPQGALEISSVVGHPPSLDRNHFSTPRVVAESHRCDERLRPSSQRQQYPTLYRRLKRRLGHSHRENLCKRSVVKPGKKATHKCSRAEGGFYGPSKVQGPVSKPNSVSCHRQLNSGSLHKQTRWNPLGRDVRSPVEDHDLVPSLPDNTKSQTHSRVSECDGQPVVQVEPSSVNRMVTASAGVQTDLSQVVHPSCRSICHLPEPQSSTVRVSSPRPKFLGHRCSEHKLVGSPCLCLPSYGSPSQGDPKSPAIQLPDHHNCPRLARMPWFWDLVQLSTEIPLQLPVSRTLLKQSHNYVFHSNPQHLNLHAWCLGVDSSKNKASLWKWQREMLPLRDHQQGPSKSKWALFEKWCRENSVDFSTPSVKQVSVFFVYLYQDLNRHPSTIDGYRKAIVDTMDPTGLHISQNSDLNRLLSSFHRDRPKSSRNLPQWNLSVVLNELTKAPFEPMKDTDLKHLTLKTAFLLALASGKRRGEIRAWVANKYLI